MPLTNLIITPELSYKIVVFVNNGRDRNLRNEIVCQTIFSSSYTISLSHPTYRAWLTNMCPKTAVSFGQGLECGCSVLYYVLWFGSYVYAGSIPALRWSKVSSRTDFLRASQCQAALSYLHWLKVILALKTSGESYQTIKLWGLHRGSVSWYSSRNNY